MVPPEFENFFLASAGASATLVGLLFIAISIGPERFFGSEAPAEQLTTAQGAFTALINTFFISLGALIPDALGVLVLVMSAFSLLNTLGLSRRLWRGWREKRSISRGAGLVLLSFILYGLELWYGWSLVRTPTETSYVSVLAFLLLGIYGVGLGRAWELLGARRWGLLAWFLSPRERDDARSGSPPSDREPSNRDS